MGVSGEDDDGIENAGLALAAVGGRQIQVTLEG